MVCSYTTTSRTKMTPRSFPTTKSMTGMAMNKYRTHNLFSKFAACEVIGICFLKTIASPYVSASLHLSMGNNPPRGSAEQQVLTEEKTMCKWYCHST
ncbi:uncharacterized protein BDV17DRAFT_251584 [Aspergillus undulatus]|uniref:uncharacterized protein n=1 Tax=Aspergillus undulatus TaxID=1810928 RepID=UPI003CCD5E4A